MEFGSPAPCAPATGKPSTARASARTFLGACVLLLAAMPRASVAQDPLDPAADGTIPSSWTWSNAHEPSASP
mgnify:CR=1 FL=1